MTIQLIDKAHAGDINIPNEPFPLYGRMIPSYIDGKWSYRTVGFPPEEVSEMTFPDENYDYDAMSEDCFFVGAYDGGRCVGLAIWQKPWHKYLYLYDLKVIREYRGRGVASALIRHGRQLAAQLGYRGVYTIGQDNNLNACKFYLKCGFEIGGFDNHVYNGTRQEGKADIYFYLANTPQDGAPGQSST